MTNDIIVAARYQDGAVGISLCFGYNDIEDPAHWMISNHHLPVTYHRMRRWNCTWSNAGGEDALMKLNFEYLFDRDVLERGLEYWKDGKVDHMVIDSGRITAVVSGTKDYDVLIEYDQEDIRHFSCECPHFESGHYCKHLAA